MIELNINFGKSPLVSEWQKKTFKTESDAIFWCQRNYQKIWTINDYRTFGQEIVGTDVLLAIRGVEN